MLCGLWLRCAGSAREGVCNDVRMECFVMCLVLPCVLCGDRVIRASRSSHCVQIAAHSGHCPECA